MTNERTPGSILKDLECYSGNVSELAGELYAKLIDPATNQFKPVTLQFAVNTINVAIAKFKETRKECEGVDTTISLPEGPAGLIIKLLLEALQIKL